MVECCGRTHFLTFCFTCGLVLYADSYGAHANENHARQEKIIDDIAKHIGASLKGDRSYAMNAETAVERIFQELNLISCNETTTATTCNTCFSKQDLLSWSRLSPVEFVTANNLVEISASIIYILTQQISRQNENDVCKNTKNGAVAASGNEEQSVTSYVFKMIQTKYTHSEDDHGVTALNEKSLIRLFHDLKRRSVISNQAGSKKCFSAHDVIAYTGVSEERIDEHDFGYIASYILLQFLDGGCIASDVAKELPEPRYFLEEIFQHFGNVTHITSDSFEVLYKTLNLGTDEENDDSGEDEHHEDGEQGGHHRHKRSVEFNKCFSADEILKIYSVSNDSVLDQQKFQQICPSLIQQLEAGGCRKQHAKHEQKVTVAQETENWKPWIGMLLSVTVVSLASLSGIFAAPLSNRKWFPYFIMYLISLAVAVLIGDAILHLYPHAVGLHQHKPDEGDHAHDHSDGNPMLKAESYLWKGLCFLIGIFLFFLFEVIMHAFGAGHGHSHGMEEHVASSSTNHSLNVKGTLRMSEDSVVYNLTDEDSRILTRPSGIHQCHDENSLHDNELDTVASNTPELSRTGSPNSQSMLLKKDSTVDSSHLTERKKSRDKPVSLKQFQSVAWMVLIGDGIHNFLDGIAIGVAFSEGWPDGLHGGISTSIAILCHELPHELGDFAVLLNSGLSIKQALVMNFISSLMAYIGGIIGVSLGTQWAASPWVFAFTAGLFIYIALVDMLPEVLHSAILKLRPMFCIMLSTIGLWTGFGIMIVLAAWEDDIKTVLKH